MWRHHIGRFLPVVAPAAFVLPTARITFCGKDRLGTLNGISMAGTFILFPLRKLLDKNISYSGLCLTVGNSIEKLLGRDDVPILDLARRREFARDSALVLAPTRQESLSQADYQSDQAHAAACLGGASCSRCNFEAGFAGELRRGSSCRHAPCENLAWSSICSFRHPATNSLKTWIAIRPYDWGGPFAVGCWVCNAYQQDYRSSFARLAVSTSEAMHKSNFVEHAAKTQHKLALQRLVDSFQVCRLQSGIISGQVSH